MTDSAMVMEIDDPSTWTRGRLANNAVAVMGLQSALRGGLTLIDSIPRRLEGVIKEQAWRKWQPGDQEKAFSCASFRVFVAGPISEGYCQADVSVIRRVLRDTPILLAEFERLWRGERGGANNPTGANQYSEVNRNNVTVDHEPSIIPIGIPTQQGNSVSYGIRRLRDHRPDLLEKVKLGELTPHGAMVLAGFRERSVTVPLDPEKAARRLLLHFTGDDLSTLITHLGRGI